MTGHNVLSLKLISLGCREEGYLSEHIDANGWQNVDQLKYGYDAPSSTCFCLIYHFMHCSYKSVYEHTFEVMSFFEVPCYLYIG